MFRRLTARQPFYNWELRFSDGEQHPGEGGGAQESGGGGASEKTDGEGEDIAADQTREGGRYEAGTVDQVGAGGEGEAEAVVGEQADEVVAGDEEEAEEEAGGGGGGGGGGKLDGDKAGAEGEGNALGERNFKRWVVRLLQLEERWRVKGFQLSLKPQFFFGEIWFLLFAFLNSF